LSRIRQNANYVRFSSAPLPIRVRPSDHRGQEKHDKNDKGDENLTGGEARAGTRHSARWRMLFEPAVQIIFGLEIDLRLAQRFQLLHHESFDLPLD